MPLLDRRRFLKAAGAGFAVSLSPPAQAAVEQADAVFATAYQRRDGAYGVGVLSEAGELLFSTELPDRGHDVTFDPRSRRSVVFARRPGTFAVVFDHGGGQLPLTLTSPEGRHFFGHGLFSPDGKLLYATENDYDKAAGLIGVYDATDRFRRIGEFPTHGMDPHEVILMPDGKTLAIANGGIETHPDFGRSKLNVATMKPSLVFVDRLTGSLLEEHVLSPALHQLSIRHMALDGGGDVWFGCQFEGPPETWPPLVGRVRRGEELQLIDMPEDALTGLRNYVGSVAANPDAGTVAVSSPQGNSLVVLDAANARVVESKALKEVCGLAPDTGAFVASTGTGVFVDPTGGRHVEADYVWDNHLLRIERRPG